MRSFDRVLAFVMAAVMLLTAGCESFSRKFTRKKSAEREVEMVLAPEEYSASGQDPQELYRQNLLYWRSWYDEFFSALSPGGNRKRQLYCLDESLKHLRACIGIAGAAEQPAAREYVNRILKLRGGVESDIYGNRVESFRNPAEVLKKEISVYLNSMVPAAEGQKHVD
ncbi:MAG: hypothetical protein PHE11_06290 [Candidatus Omnitrophica bacterium]|nr:hypothetical protein [Candidatus Omnitrophota bacterium]